jgi:hypothetical protein
MPDAGTEPSPTGPFGEAAGERSATPEEAVDPASRHTAQHFFGRRKGEGEATGTEGTAERAPRIDRAKPEE